MVRYVVLVLVAVGLLVAGCSGDEAKETRTLREVIAEVEVGDDIHALGARVEDEVERGVIVARSSSEAWVEKTAEFGATGCWRFGSAFSGMSEPTPPGGWGAWVVCHREGEIVREPIELDGGMF